MDEDPSNRLESLGFETCSGDEAEAMEIDETPASTDWRVQILEWIDRGRLPSVIWSLRTTPSRATGFSPFFLVYGAEAVLPTDLEYGSPRLKAYQEQRNQELRENSLDQVDEARDVALIHSARYQQSLRRYQSQRV